MAWPTVGETLKGAGLICVSKLSGKKTTGKHFSGESLAGGDRRGNPVQGRVISQVKGQRRGLLKANHASILFYRDLVGNDKARRKVKAVK